MKFDLPKDKSSIIKVIGVGGGGSNAVNHMFQQGITGVDFIICNTDAQALDISPVPIKIQLGKSLTEGLGAGSKPEIGRNAAIESIDDLREMLEKNTKMLFITAGMGGGTGTGAAPVIAEAARELGILTVGIVTIPFSWEGPRRKTTATEGLDALRQNVDTLLVVNNDKLREIYGNLPVGQAFTHADDVLTIGAKGIAEIITRTGYINVDFEDVKSVMTNSGVAIMGSAQAEGEGRSVKAVEQALASPLLNDSLITGAKNVLLNITFGTKELLMDEISDITDFIKAETKSTDDIIWGYGLDDTLEESIRVTIIATGFETDINMIQTASDQSSVNKRQLEDNVPTMLTKPIDSNDESDDTITEPHLKENYTSSETDEEKSDSSQPVLFPSDMNRDEDEKNDLNNVSEKEKTAVEEEDSFEIRQLDESEPASEENKGQVFEFDLNSTTKSGKTEEESDDPYIRKGDATDKLEEDLLPTEPENPDDENIEKTMNRISKLKELSLKLRTPSGISDLENEPAYKRKQVKLDNPPHSSESEISRFTLSESEEDEDGNKKTIIKPNNSFLHDNVD